MKVVLSYNILVTRQADLTAYIFEGQPHTLSSILDEWMSASSRFPTFVDIYRDKIRKKVRVTRDPESALDLWSELEVAYFLLRDHRLDAAYEPYTSAKRRGPDFAVTYRANLVFNVEVARLRAEDGMPGGTDLPRKELRVLGIMLAKLAQMQPGMPNLLVIHTGADLARSINLARLMQEVKTRVEGRDPSFYAITRYAAPVDFYKDFLRLNAILLWPADPQLWVNKQARPELPEGVLRLVSSLASGAGQ